VDVQKNSTKWSDLIKAYSFKPVNPLTINVRRYRDKFGHLPSIEAAKFLTPDEIDDLAKNALEEGEPIAEWRDRPKLKTGTTLDLLYENSIES